MGNYGYYILVKHAEAVAWVRLTIRRSFTGNYRSNLNIHGGGYQVLSENLRVMIPNPKSIVVTIPNITTAAMFSFFKWLSEHIIEPLRRICAEAFSWLQGQIWATGTCCFDMIAFCAKAMSSLGISNWNVSGQSVMMWLVQVESLIHRVMNLMTSFRNLLWPVRKQSNESQIIGLLDVGLFYGGFLCKILHLMIDSSLLFKEVKGTKLAFAY